jgi:Uma2 family endonuclease
MATATLHTAADLPAQRERCELVRGELRMMTPAGQQHGYVVANLTVLIGAYVRENHLGKCFGAETGFFLEHDPDTVRAPDLAFVAAGREVAGPGTSFAICAPDLVAEVVSPTDRWSDVMAKADFWLAHGVRLVLVVDPATRQVHRLSTSERTALSGDAHLELGGVLPQFSLPISQIFA